MIESMINDLNLPEQKASLFDNLLSLYKACKNQTNSSLKQYSILELNEIRSMALKSNQEFIDYIMNSIKGNVFQEIDNGEVVSAKIERRLSEPQNFLKISQFYDIKIRIFYYKLFEIAKYIKWDVLKSPIKKILTDKATSKEKLEKICKLFSPITCWGSQLTGKFRDNILKVINS